MLLHRVVSCMFTGYREWFCTVASDTSVYRRYSILDLELERNVGEDPYIDGEHQSCCCCSCGDGNSPGLPSRGRLSAVAAFELALFCDFVLDLRMLVQHMIYHRHLENATMSKLHSAGSNLVTEEKKWHEPQRALLQTCECHPARRSVADTNPLTHKIDLHSACFEAVYTKKQCVLSVHSLMYQLRPIAKGLEKRCAFPTAQQFLWEIGQTMS